MEKMSLEVNKSYLDKAGNMVTITSICVEVSTGGEIETVLVVHANDKFYWLRLPHDNEIVKTWRTS